MGSEASKEKVNKNVHQSHRERMRERGQASSFLAYSDHELFEMLLYSSIKRGDTNEVAHTLIEQFGGLNGVIEASFDELCAVPGIGASSAHQVMLVGEFIRRYVGGFVENHARYDTVRKIAEFVWPRFLGLKQERLYQLTFDNKLSITGLMIAAEGSINSVQVDRRRLFKYAMEKNAACVVLAHNHPHGVAVPSEMDTALTNELHSCFSLLNIPLLEHLIIAEDRFIPIVRKYCTIPNATVNANLVLRSLDGFDLDRFYGDEEDYLFDELFRQTERNLNRSIEEAE